MFAPAGRGSPQTPAARSRAKVFELLPKLLVETSSQRAIIDRTDPVGATVQKRMWHHRCAPLSSPVREAHADGSRRSGQVLPLIGQWGGHREAKVDGAADAHGQSGPRQAHLQLRTRRIPLGRMTATPHWEAMLLENAARCDRPPRLCKGSGGLT